MTKRFPRAQELPITLYRHKLRKMESIGPQKSLEITMTYKKQKHASVQIKSITSQNSTNICIFLWLFFCVCTVFIHRFVHLFVHSFTCSLLSSPEFCYQILLLQQHLCPPKVICRISYQQRKNKRKRNQFQICFLLDYRKLFSDIT